MLAIILVTIKTNTKDSIGISVARSNEKCTKIIQVVELRLCRTKRENLQCAWQTGFLSNHTVNLRLV